MVEADRTAIVPAYIEGAVEAIARLHAELDPGATRALPTEHERRLDEAMPTGTPTT